MTEPVYYYCVNCELPHTRHGNCYRCGWFNGSFEEATTNQAANEFKKADKDKPSLSLVPFDALIEVAEVLAHGARKYGKDNWAKCDRSDRYVDAVLRHVVAYASGEKHDPETGRHHLAHAACSCLFLVALDLRGERK